MNYKCSKTKIPSGMIMLHLRLFMIYQEHKEHPNPGSSIHGLFNKAEITYLTLEPKYLFSFTIVNVYLCCLA